MLGYLPPVLPNQPDFGDRGHGKKTHLACHQLDYTCRIVDTAFAPEVDVTGAVYGPRLRRVGRFHRRELRYQILKCRLEILVRLRFDGHEFPLGGNTTRWECAAGTRRFSEDSHPGARVPSKLNLQTCASRCGATQPSQAVPRID